MTDQITIRNIDLALTKLRLEPGDVVFVQYEPGMLRHAEDRAYISTQLKEKLGVPVVCLMKGLELKAVVQGLAPSAVVTMANAGEPPPLPPPSDNGRGN